MKRKTKEKAKEQTPEGKAQCIKLQLKGMIGSLYMQQARNRWLSVPYKAASLYGVLLVVAMVCSAGRWHLYVTIGDQDFETEQPEPYWLYKEAMRVLS